MLKMEVAVNDTHKYSLISNKVALEQSILINI